MSVQHLLHFFSDMSEQPQVLLIIVGNVEDRA